MRSLIRTATMLLAGLLHLAVLGCSSSYEPDPEDIPNIPPSTRTDPGDSGDADDGSQQDSGSQSDNSRMPPRK